MWLQSLPNLPGGRLSRVTEGALMRVDYGVVGGGIVGLASALSLLQQRPGAGVVVLEKEQSLARHQTGHNSGVIHSGIYYPPGSLKARLCREGARATRELCAEQGVPVLEQGKVLVATDARDSARLAALEERAGLNGIESHRLSAAQLRDLEPHVTGVGALHVPSTGSVDFAALCEAMRRAVVALGGAVVCGAEVTGIRESPSEVTVTAGDQEWRVSRLVACGGLQSDRLARMAGVRVDARIVPFRGEYFRLAPAAAGLVGRLVYPVPDPDLPFLGVHVTPMVGGAVTVGPNAVLGLSREGYRKGSVSVRDVREILGFPGFWRMAAGQVSTGAVELRNSLFRRGYLAACRRFLPDLALADLLPWEAGIRAQAVSRDGTLVHDFVFARSNRTLHVVNAPSPAATAALPIGRRVAAACLEMEGAAGRQPG